VQYGNGEYLDSYGSTSIIEVPEAHGCHLSPISSRDFNELQQADGIPNYGVACTWHRRKIKDFVQVRMDQFRMAFNANT
jgi:hypothetical protein